MTVALRILSLLLCLLTAGPMSLPAHALARPETRVGEIFSSPLKSASESPSQVVETHRENRQCDYDFVPGVHKYLYARMRTRLIGLIRVDTNLRSAEQTPLLLAERFTEESASTSLRVGLREHA